MNRRALLGAGAGVAALALPGQAAAATENAFGWLAYVDGKNGSDSNGGTSWDDAWRTIAHACSSVHAGMKILLGSMHPSQGQPDVVITKPVTIEGTANFLYSAGPYIVPASSTSTVFDIQCGNVQLTNVIINAGIVPGFTGVGVRNSQDGTIIDRYTYVGGANATGTQVGTGILWDRGEQGEIHYAAISGAQLGIHVPGANSLGSDNILRHYRPNYNLADFVMGDQGNCGGWLIDGVKAQNGGDSNGSVVWHLYPSSGGCTFVHADLAEAGPNTVLIESNDNVFIRPASAPATLWKITGSQNRFVGRIVYGTPWQDTGTDNVYL